MLTQNQRARRDFLKTSALASLAVGAAGNNALFGNTRQALENSSGKQAKNVIFLVADGMNHAAMSLANAYRQEFENRESNWVKLYKELPIVRALQETHSATGLVTDSAAAASSWGIGERIPNGAVNVTADGREPEPILRTARNAGKRVGLVTTAQLTHATPAGFAANVRSRGMQEEIAAQYFDREIDVMLGGGEEHFDGNRRDDKVDLFKKFEDAGYAVFRNREKMLQNRGSSKKLLGAFSTGHIPYDIDRKNDEALKERTPTLSEMAVAALQTLRGSDEGFVLQIEGARVDHAGHGNDAAALIHDQLAFDDTIAAVLKFVQHEPDTLVIVTTDHGTGGLQLNGAGGGYSESTPRFRTLGDVKHSFSYFAGQLRDASPGERQEIVQKHLGYEVTMDEARRLRGSGDLTRLVGDRSAVTWTSGNHTADLVEFAAFGPGSEMFSPFLQNRDVHGILLKAAAIKATAKA